jgi:hypothetical protein
VSRLKPFVEYPGLARSEDGITSPHVPRQRPSENRLPGGQRKSSVVARHADDRELAILMQAAQAGDAGAYSSLARWNRSPIQKPWRGTPKDLPASCRGTAHCNA